MIHVVCDPGSRYTKMAVSRPEFFEPLFFRHASHEVDELGLLVRASAASLRPGLFEPVRVWVAGDGWVPRRGGFKPVLLGTALARAALSLGPSALVADCGGLRTRVFEVADGKLKRTLENERCTSGGGRFVETMAAALGVGLEGLDDAISAASSPIRVSSPCMVFAESEMISQVNSGVARGDVLAGVVAHAVEKAASLIQQAGPSGRPVVVTGGLAGLRSFTSGLADALPGVRFVRPRVDPLNFNVLSALSMVCDAREPEWIDVGRDAGEGHAG